MARRGAGAGMVVSVALIFAGALGNIIDSTIYGVIFSESTPLRKAVLFPPEGGYGTLFHGSVVDMFHFPIWRGRKRFAVGTAREGEWFNRAVTSVRVHHQYEI